MRLPEVFLDWSWSNGSSVTILSGNIPSGTNALGEPILTTAIGYSGPANVFDETGVIIDNVLGSIASEVLSVIIDGTLPLVDGRPTLPAGISVGDVLTIDGDPDNRRFVIQYAHYWDTYPFCLKLACNLEKG